MLGAQAARRLGIDRVFPGERVWLGGTWFYVAGILRPAVLAPEIDRSVLVGFDAAKRHLGFDGHPTEMYVRADTAGRRCGAVACSPRPPTPSTRTRSTSASPPPRSRPARRRRAR